MNLQRVINSPQAGWLALTICKLLPPAPGKAFARFVADRIAARKGLPLVRAMRINQYVVSGCRYDAAGLDWAVRSAIRNLGETYYTLYHNISNQEGLEKHIEVSPELEEIIARSQKNARPQIVLGVHLSNFDLVLQAAGWRGLHAAALTLPEDSENREAVEWQHQFRRHAGIEMLPASFGSFRQAITRLEQGGTILTGVDRPIPTPKHKPHFFGQPANLPVHYVTMGLAAKAPMALLSVIQRSNGKYHIQVSDEIMMTSYSDRQKEILVNAEKVLEVAADRIRQAPDQWNIFQPVWDGFEAELP